MSLSIGKRRGLAQCATDKGAFAILALDHRENLRRSLNPDNPGSVSDEDMIEFKEDVVRHVVPAASGVLLDPEVGAPYAVAADLIPGRVGMIVSLEATGYTGDPDARLSQILEGWSAGKIRRMGANALKLLIYYHPESSEASHQEKLIELVGRQCRELDLAFFLEPLSFSLHRDRKLSSIEKWEVVIETARRLTPLGVDVLKAEFPLNITEEKDKSIWRQACDELTASTEVPWVLLSAGVAFEDFLIQTMVALEAGASGVLAGRAIWGEAVNLEGTERTGFLEETAAERMTVLKDTCNSLAKPWTVIYPPEELDSNWFQSYSDLPGFSGSK